MIPRAAILLHRGGRADRRAAGTRPGPAPVPPNAAQRRSPPQKSGIGTISPAASTPPAARTHIFDLRPPKSITDDCLLAQAPSWEPCGRTRKYGSLSAWDSAVTGPPRSPAAVSRARGTGAACPSRPDPGLPEVRLVWTRSPPGRLLEQHGPGPRLPGRRHRGQHHRSAADRPAAAASASHGRTGRTGHRQLLSWRPVSLTGMSRSWAGADRWSTDTDPHTALCPPRAASPGGTFPATRRYPDIGNTPRTKAAQRSPHRGPALPIRCRR